MRFLMTVNIPTDLANEAARTGELGKKIEAILEEVKPEAAYFSAENGMRTAYLIVDMKDASEMPRLAEPWFLAFEAEIDARPVMPPEDLAKAAPDIRAAVEKFG